ncbi:MAG: hypothetical protein ACR2MP_18535 [Streptosporangiaceae bacterium]
MTDFEERLRTAMESSVAGKQPPGNLAEKIRRRHRRHLARVAVAGIAVVVAAVAVVPPTRAALLEGGRATRIVSPAPDVPARGTRPSPHGQYYGCDSQIYGNLGPQWRKGNTQAGPVWLINRGTAPNFKFYNADGTLKAVPVIVMLRDNSTAWVQPSGTEERYFRFLPGFNGTDRYTLHDGKARATFAGCSDQKSMYGNGFTEFYLGVIVAGPRCITLEVRTPGSKQPIPATLTFGKCGTSK